MEKFLISNIEVLPDVPDPMFEQREFRRTRTPYETEVCFYSCIKNGDSKKLRRMAEEMLENKLVVGRLSNDNMRQIKYWAVCCIAVGVRYAIEGGLDETIAYNLSDEYIMHIDKMNFPQEVVEFLNQKSVGLADMVREAKLKDYPQTVRECMKYISLNLHEKLSIERVAQNCGFSADYLSSLFKKVTGERLSVYIRRSKLEAARDMLKGKCDYAMVGHYFAFCSESHFISCFKKEFGMTPREYVNSLGY